jgi:hypothetical protein
MEDLQRFLGLNPALGPPVLPHENVRRMERADGWPIHKPDLEHLLSLLRPEAERWAPCGAPRSRPSRHARGPPGVRRRGRGRGPLRTAAAACP